MDFRYLLNKQFVDGLNALPEEFNVLAMALESTNSGVVITDYRQADNPIIFCNHAFENMTGYSREEIIGQNCRFLQGKDRAQDSLQLLRDSIEQGIPVTVELRNYDKNGELFWNELSIAPVRDSEGSITHFIGIQNDVTRKRALQTDLKEQIDLLNRRLEKQDRYIKKVEEILSTIMESKRQCLVMLDENFNIVRANANFYQIFQTKANEVIGKPFESIHQGQWHHPELHALMLKALNKNQPFEEFPLYLSQPNEDCHQVTVTGSKIQIEGITRDHILVVIRCKFTTTEKQTAVALVKS
jgi:PAS domain S-box-containing protein